MSTVDRSNMKKLTAEIVIIGGGGSGLPAATTAAEAGIKRIIVLEKRNILGGNANMAGGMFAAESPAQKRIGETLTKDQAYKNHMDYAHWTVDPKVVRAFINISAEVIEWIENKGLIFNNVTQLGVRGETPFFFHRLSKDPEGRIGAPLMKTLTKQCQDMGIEILRETAATKILLDDEGKVSGVLAEKDGEQIEISAKAVVIASGGFAGNKEMMDKYLPSHSDRYSLSLPLMGDGIRMAEEVNAITDDIYSELMVGPCHYPYATTTSPLRQLLFRPEIILVNKQGERFVDESLRLRHGRWVSNSLNRQQDEICYALVDTSIIETIIEKREQFTGTDKDRGSAWMDGLIDDFKKDDSKDLAKISDTLDGIAEYIGVNPEILKDTVRQYNSACEKGYDPDFLKDSNFLLPLNKPPYYALLAWQGFDSTFGGIKINNLMEVIDKKFNPIRGLYATGNITGGWISTMGYNQAGTSLGFAVCSGYMAGKNAAKYVTLEK